VKKAFSLIELIFVMVILGIVASLSSQIIVQVYDNYLTQRALYNTTTKTEMVANQIVNRLTFAIDGTTITKEVDNYGTPTGGFIEGTDWIMLRDIGAAGTKFTTVEWIGYDNDSFAAGATPYWSGVADYTTATRDSFVSPGSDFSNVATIMTNLSNGEVDLTTSHPAAIIFAQQDNEYRDGMEYTPLCMGLIDTGNTSCIFPVSNTTPLVPNDNNLTFTRVSDPNNATTLAKIVSERYKMAWSAYAIVPELNSEGLHDLFLYYNYQPWNREKYKVHASKSLLMKNISVFKFTENGGVIQFKLCGSENIGADYNISSCKEKAIIK